MQNKHIRTALISVFEKTGLESLLCQLNKLNCKLVSTGGTLTYIQNLGFNVSSVEELTGFPSILGGRVKTLHPKIFGAILARTENPSDREELLKYDISTIDMVVVDLYPFEATVASAASHDEIIEKIDIGGISLIRAAAKNYNDVLIVSHKNQYPKVVDLLGKGYTTLEERREYAREAFAVTAHYDTQIWQYLEGDLSQNFRISHNNRKELRYGENPHQKGFFYGNIDNLFDIYGGKELSYNNLLDIDAAVNLISEFDEPTVAILKHNNACGVASRETILNAWTDALAGDPISAFGGVIITNSKIDSTTALEIDKLFYEVLIAPDYDDTALDILRKKNKRIILKQKPCILPRWQYRTVLNGTLVQDKDLAMSQPEGWQTVTQTLPSPSEKADLLFANKIVKHTKSNTIVLAKNKQLIGSGTGQTSRVDALKHAIIKAKSFGLNLQGAVMASDAFFPFPDCVEIAWNEGIRAVIQPGGSIKDQESIDFCNRHNMSMVLTGIRHFKH